MAKFHIDVLEQDRDTFELEDGTEIEFRNRSDFSARDQALALRLGRSVGKLAEQIEKQPKNHRLEKRWEAKQRTLLHMILPDLPEEFERTLTAGKIAIITNWWFTQQEERYGPERLASMNGDGEYYGEDDGLGED